MCGKLSTSGREPWSAPAQPGQLNLPFEIHLDAFLYDPLEVACEADLACRDLPKGADSVLVLWAVIKPGRAPLELPVPLGGQVHQIFGGSADSAGGTVWPGLDTRPARWHQNFMQDKGGRRAGRYDEKFSSGAYGRDTVYLNQDPHHYHQEILKRIDEERRSRGRLRILDVGCATGYIGGAARRPGDTVTGIEISRQAAEQALERLDEVMVADVESAGSSLEGMTFDVLICSDILEHLCDPESALSALADHLAPRGLVLVVLPNVAYVGIRLMLLAGIWRYSEHGIMDRGHLRWFTRATGAALLEAAGLEVEEILPWVDLPGPLRRLSPAGTRFCRQVPAAAGLLAKGFLFVARGRATEPSGSPGI